MGDTLDKLKARADKLRQDREQLEARERKAAAKIRTEVEARKVRQATLIGETIRDAGDLSEHERSVIAGILARRPNKPKDWEKISTWLVAPNDAGGEGPAVSPAG